MGDVARVDPAAVQAIGGPDESRAAAADADAGRAETEWRFVDAVRLRTRAVLFAPESGMRFQRLGLLVEQCKLVREASSIYRRALELDARLRDSGYRLGICYQQQGRFMDAREWWSRLIQVYPDDLQAHVRLAVMCYYLEDFDAAWEHVRAAEALGGSVPPHFLANLEERSPPP